MPPAIPFGGIHYRSLENDKIQALKTSRGNFDATMALSKLALSDIDWWISHLDDSFGYTSRSPPNLILYSNAFLSGWGAALGSVSSGGPWSSIEALYHINVLEFNSLFCPKKL